MKFSTNTIIDRNLIDNQIKLLYYKCCSIKIIALDKLNNQRADL